MCAAQHLKCYYDPEDLCGEEWELNDEETAALDLQEAASPMEFERELPDMNAEKMAKEGFYLVKSVLRHRYRQGWCFLTLWEGFGVEEATCTYDFSTCFFPKFKKSTKRGFSREMTYFFGFYGPKIGGGVLLPEFCPKISKTLKFGLF